MPAPTLSLIIPCWGDDALLREKISTWSTWPQVQEIIIATADAPSSHPWPENVRLVTASQPNRGLQMNLGAAQASGDILLFHHADSELTPVHLDAVIAALHEPAILGGAFHRAFDARHPAFRWLEKIERWRNAHSGSLFGDQSIFVRRAQFVEMGGYANHPLMEDLEFSRRLRRAGRIILLDPPMRSSDRRHRTRGAWRTSLQNGLFILLYHLGVSPVTLHRWYYPSKS